jgi:predicted GNAT family N-acyltransferase
VAIKRCDAKPSQHDVDRRITAGALCLRCEALPQVRHVGACTDGHQDHAVLVLHAQTHAIDFYNKHGFQIEGDEFLEAGIPHRRMTLKL